MKIGSIYRNILNESNIKNILINKIGLNDDEINFIYDTGYFDYLISHRKYIIWLANVVKKEGINNIDPDDVELYVNYLFREANRPPLPKKLYDISMDGAEILLKQLSLIHKWQKESEVETPNIKNMDWYDVYDMAEQGVGQIDHETGRILHRFPDGFYWIDLGNWSCKKEGKVMGHCGETDIKKGSTLLSLRKDMKPFVTVGYYPQNKTATMIRGRNDINPISKYHPYIVWLLSNSDMFDSYPEEGGIKDFGINDLSPKYKEILMDKNPKLFNI